MKRAMDIRHAVGGGGVPGPQSGTRWTQRCVDHGPAKHSANPRHVGEDAHEGSEQVFAAVRGQVTVRIVPRDGGGHALHTICDAARRWERLVEAGTLPRFEMKARRFIVEE